MAVPDDCFGLQRWIRAGDCGDRRRGPETPPSHTLSTLERSRVLETLNAPAYRDLSPRQIVPKRADAGVYLASESTMYRILKAEGQLTHRGRAKPRRASKPQEQVATAPNQVWSWDITYLRSNVRGAFFYLYMVVDVWSRKVVAFRVHDRECSNLAAEMLRDAVWSEGTRVRPRVLHQDNGGPMKGATLKATLEALGILPSYSRPRVSDDNPFSEALFRTLKYRPNYPRKPFKCLDDAARWSAEFVSWYNHQHLHSSIGYVTPDDRHRGHDKAIRRKRAAVYNAAACKTPRRWSRHTRTWQAPAIVILNPANQTLARDGSLCVA